MDMDSDNEMFMNNEKKYKKMAQISDRSADEDIPLQKLSPFTIQKGFQAIDGTLKSIKRLTDGSFMAECGKRAQVQNLLQTNCFVDRPVRVSVHKILNSSRGAIICRDHADMSEVEIRDELKDQGMVGVNWVTLKKEGKVIPTNTLLDVWFSRTPKRDYSWLSKGECGLVCSKPGALLQLQQAWPCEPKLLWSVSGAENISMKVSVWDPSCARIAVVPTLHWLKIARSGRRFNMSTLKNASPFWKPDSW